MILVFLSTDIFVYNNCSMFFGQQINITYIVHIISTILLLNDSQNISY